MQKYNIIIINFGQKTTISYSLLQRNHEKNMIKSTFQKHLVNFPSSRAHVDLYLLSRKLITLIQNLSDIQTFNS
jgi:hypothetical protein